MSDLVAINCDNSTITGSSPVLVLAEVLQLQQEAVSLRRWFHANAELSYQEFDTAKKIVEALRSFGIQEIYEGIGKTGVVAVIRGQSTTETATETAAEHNCIALRADMDALPITEVSEVSYRSRNAGAMHACGHDGHVAGLLIAAKVLQNSRTNLRGSVKLVFQPAEEGYAGAAAMIEDGLLDGTACGPSVDSIYGIHLWSSKSIDCLRF